MKKKIMSNRRDTLKTSQRWSMKTNSREIAGRLERLQEDVRQCSRNQLLWQNLLDDLCLLFRGLCSHQSDSAQSLRSIADVLPCPILIHAAGPCVSIVETKSDNWNNSTRSLTEPTLRWFSQLDHSESAANFQQARSETLFVPKRKNCRIDWNLSSPPNTSASESFSEPSLHLLIQLSVLSWTHTVWCQFRKECPGFWVRVCLWHVVQLFGQLFDGAFLTEHL